MSRAEVVTTQMTFPRIFVVRLKTEADLDTFAAME